MVAFLDSHFPKAFGNGFRLFVELFPSATIIPVSKFNRFILRILPCYLLQELTHRNIHHIVHRSFSSHHFSIWPNKQAFVFLKRRRRRNLRGTTSVDINMPTFTRQLTRFPISAEKTVRAYCSSFS